MRKTLIILVAVVLRTAISSAQTSFMQFYNSAGTAKVNLNQLSSGNYLTGLGTGNNTSAQVLLDPFGNVLHTQCYAIDTARVLQSVKRFSDNDFAFVGGYRRDTCAINPLGIVTGPLVGRMDSLGNVVSARYYTMDAPNCGFLCRDMMITSANHVIAWGGESFFALRVDADGEVQWAKWFDYEGGIRFVRELPGGDLLMGMVMDTAGAVVARLDAQGNFLWCKSYIRPNGVVSDCLIESDDSFMITGYTEGPADTPELPPGFHTKLFAMKLNGAGEVQWCKGYDNAQYLWYPWFGPRIVRAQDGNPVVLGNLGYEGWNYPYRPFLMKTDQNGDTLWTRSAGRMNHSYTAVDLLACSDNGYAYSVLSSDGLGVGIFKTDSLGRLPCYNRWHEVVVSDLPLWIAALRLSPMMVRWHTRHT